MKIKIDTTLILAALTAAVVGARKEIWFYLEPLPKWWKILIAGCVSVFFTLAWIYALGFEWWLLELIKSF